MEQPVAPQPVRKGTNWVTIVLAGCVIPLLLVMCCVVAGIGVYVIAPDTLSPVLAVLGIAGKAQAAAYAPAQSPMFVAMDVDLKQVVNAQRIFKLVEKNMPAQGSSGDLRKQFRDSTGCDFDTDIAPWWGPDAALFLTDANNLVPPPGAAARSSSQPTPNLVFAIGTRDAAKAQAAIQKCSSKAKVKSQETYEGNKITNYDPNGAVAIVGKYMLIATTTDAMHAAIDASRGKVKTLETSDDYKNTIARLPASRVATMYFQMSALISMLSQMQTTGIQPQTFSQFDFYKGMGMSLGFEPNGARLDAVVLFDTAKMPACMREMMQTTNANRALNAVPASSVFYVGGLNYKNAWDCQLSMMDSTTKKQMDDAFAQLNKQMGIDVNADVFSWMTGEFALVVTQAKPLSTGMPGVGVLALIEAKDKELATSKMSKIANALGKQGLAFKPQTVNGVSMQVVKLGSPNDPAAPSAGYGMIGDFMAIGGPLDALGSAVDASKNPLANDSAFQAIQKVLPAKNSGYFYLNMTALDKLISDSLSTRERTNYQKDVQPLVKLVKGIGATNEIGKGDSATAMFFVYVPDQ